MPPIFRLRSRHSIPKVLLWIPIKKHQKRKLSTFAGTRSERREIYAAETIVGYFRAGHFEDVLRLYLRLESGGVGFHTSTITFALKSCVELENLGFGKGVHVGSLKVGLSKDRFVGSSLVGLYSKLGCIHDARQVFDEISEKDVVAHTAMITAYSQFADSLASKAFEIARDMVRNEVSANRVTSISLLQCAGRLKALKEGKTIHCYSLRRGIGFFDEPLQTAIVDMYAKCDAKDSATFMLKFTGRRAIALWNAMIAGLINRGESSEAIEYFYIIQQEEKQKLSPDSITLATLLSACRDLSYTGGVTSIHGYLIRRHVPLDVVLTTALIELYAKCNKIEGSKILFDELIMRRDLVSYNVMISAYLQNGSVFEAIKLLSAMSEEGIKPNSVTLLSFLSAFTDLRDERRGKCVHGCVIRNGLGPNLDISNQILHMYGSFGRIEVSRKIFDSMANKDIVSWTTMMTGCVNSGFADEAIELYQLMQQEGAKPDSVTLSALLQALSRLDCLELVKGIHGYIYRTSSEKDMTIRNSLITTYARLGRMDMSENIFRSMVGRELSSWNTLIAAYGMHGSCAEALELFKQMEREKVKPDALTFTSVLSACSHAGLVEEGRDVFLSMNSRYSIVPNEEHYNCIVDLFSRAGYLEEAYDVARSSPSKERASAFCALLAACRSHGNLKLGEAIGKQLLDSEPKNSSIYALVSSVYAQGGKWNEAADLRTVAEEVGLRKSPGYSLIESSNDLLGHDFFE